MGRKFDFSGWATRNNLRCSDGRTIRRDAFKDCDGMEVPLVWNHRHNDAANVLGHALLENREDGVYTYGTFNDTPEGQRAKALVQHGDIKALSIYANQLEQHGSDVLHGAIREVSLVLAGANPGAWIDNVLSHSDSDYFEDECVLYTGESICLSHSDDEEEETEEGEDSDMFNEDNEYEEYDEELSHADDGDETIEDVINSMNEKQKTVLYALVGEAAGDNNESEDGKEMKHNVFDNDARQNDGFLTHADQEAIIAMAKQTSVGSFQDALAMYIENETSLSHSFEDIEALYPEYKNITPGAPELITTDQGWISKVINGVSKSPISRIKTRMADAKNLEEELRALGYKKGDKKVEMPNIKLIGRSMDPQTIYVKDKLDRDDIIDITDFDVVEYEYKLMRLALNEEIATAIMLGDGREDGDEHKIHETHIKPIWTDDELYTIHQTVDIEAAKAELQGTDTGKHFGENYIYAEAIITAALYSREKYKGSGNLEFYCTPHLLNVMLLARDLNGRRIYSSKSDLAAALNVKDIITVEQFENKTRISGQGPQAKTKKLLGLFVNLSDYKVGSTKGGEITKFEDFDIDFNQYKYLMETRLSGGLTKILSAIALEEDVTVDVAG